MIPTISVKTLRTHCAVLNAPSATAFESYNGALRPAWQGHGLGDLIAQYVRGKLTKSSPMEILKITQKGESEIIYLLAGSVRLAGFIYL